MGIEGEQLVFDYLSRVGDLAHSTSMTASDRARLVNGLRAEIDRMRAEEGGAQSKSAVRRILGRLGKPEEVVAARGGGSVSAAGLSDVMPQPRGPAASVRDGSLGERARARAREAREQARGARDRFAKPGGGAAGGGSGGSVGGVYPAAPEPSGGAEAPGSSAASGASGASAKDADSLWKKPLRARRSRAAAPGQPAPTLKDLENNAPHLAGLDELGPSETGGGAGVDWWRLEAGPGEGSVRSSGAADLPPGFTGGIELPEVLKPPPSEDEEEKPAPPAPGIPPQNGGAPQAPPTAPGDGAEPAVVSGRPSLGDLLFFARKRRATGGPRAGGFVELAAALLLLAGAVTGSLIPLGLGWLAAWWSPRLPRTEAKWAAAGMPGVVAAGAAVWLWGRSDGRWGDPLPAGGEAMRAALNETWPVLLRLAAVASALFLLWRARRSVGG
ncbi:hypothetical protein [Streptomyces sp. ODS28]|uniref:hypothetical protein n=1 Tax=Streptomyces sp. ODS28 TaxID=3136688 RepID=UPI0031E97A2B